jgi:GH15 family glucan-1,4-alpha-glucosidase
MTAPWWGAVQAGARWRIALAMIGQTGRARALGQKLLSFAGPRKLCAEEIDTTTGEHLGDFPQVFTHLALTEAAPLLIEPERQDGAAQGI